MDTTSKQFSHYDYEQIFQQIYNQEGATISVDGFLVGKVGRRVTVNISTTTVANDTETFTYSENGVNLFTIQSVYTDGTREQLIYAERTA